MIFHKLGLINKNQRGFTLIELLVAIAISGVIAGAIAMSVFQMVSGSAHSNNHMTAVRQVQNAGYWVSRDAQMAQDVDTGDNPPDTGFPLTLTWTDWDSNEHQVSYTLEGEELWCDHNGQRMRVAQYINPDPTKTNCEVTDGVLVFTVTANVGGRQPASETRVYEILPRPGS